jgi:hypothetical protein
MTLTGVETLHYLKNCLKYYLFFLLVNNMLQAIDRYKSILVETVLLKFTSGSGIRN